ATPPRRRRRRPRGTGHASTSAPCAGSSSPWGRRSAATCAGTGARRARRPSCSRTPTTRAAPPCRSRRSPCRT
ncbi:Os01g0839100, partial [Oryza sativa Japonica Group]